MKNFLFFLFFPILLFACSKETNISPSLIDTDVVGMAGGQQNSCNRITVPYNQLAPLGSPWQYPHFYIGITDYGELNKHQYGSCQNQHDLCSIFYYQESRFVQFIDKNILYTPQMQDAIIATAKTVFADTYPNGTLQRLNLWINATLDGSSFWIEYDIDYVLGECDQPQNGGIGF